MTKTEQRDLYATVLGQIVAAEQDLRPSPNVKFTVTGYDRDLFTLCENLARRVVRSVADYEADLEAEGRE